MSNIEKLINLQKRFEKDARYYADKEDYTSFEKVIEDFINDALFYFDEYLTRYLK